MDVWLDGIGFGESPRWHDGRIWISDWAAGTVLSLDAPGRPTVEARADAFPLCFDFLPDGRPLLVAGTGLLRREPDGSLVPHADLSAVAPKGGNDIVVDDHGRAYVDSVGFDFPGGDFAPGLVALVSADGEVSEAAGDLAFPNGMALTADGGTLLVAESYAEQLTAYTIAADGALSDRRVWAPTPGDHPDGICVDATGAAWYADVGHGHAVRVREGGDVLDTVDFDRGAFACVLSRGPDPRLFVVGQQWQGPDAIGGGEPSGRLASYPAPAPGAGHP